MAPRSSSALLLFTISLLAHCKDQQIASASGGPEEDAVTLLQNEMIVGKTERTRVRELLEQKQTTQQSGGQTSQCLQEHFDKFQIVTNFDANMWKVAYNIMGSREAQNDDGFVPTICHEAMDAVGGGQEVYQLPSSMDLDAEQATMGKTCLLSEGIELGLEPHIETLWTFAMKQAQCAEQDCQQGEDSDACHTCRNDGVQTALLTVFTAGQSPTVAESDCLNCIDKAVKAYWEQCSELCENEHDGGLPTVECLECRCIDFREAPPGQSAPCFTTDMVNGWFPNRGVPGAAATRQCSEMAALKAELSAQAHIAAIDDLTVSAQDAANNAVDSAGNVADTADTMQTIVSDLEGTMQDMTASAEQQARNSRSNGAPVVVQSPQPAGGTSMR